MSDTVSRRPHRSRSPAATHRPRSPSTSHRSRSFSHRPRSLSTSHRPHSPSTPLKREETPRRSLSKRPSPTNTNDEYYIQGSHADFTPSARARSKDRSPQPPPKKKGVINTAVRWYKEWRWDDKLRASTHVALRVRRDALLQLSDAGLALLAKKMKEPKLRRKFLLDGDPLEDDLMKERRIGRVIQKTFKLLPRLADFNRKDQELLRGIFYECTTQVRTADVIPMFIGGRCDCVELRTKNKKAAVYVLNNAAAKHAFLVRNKKYGLDEEVGECTPFTHAALFNPD